MTKCAKFGELTPHPAPSRSARPRQARQDTAPPPGVGAPRGCDSVRDAARAEQGWVRPARPQGGPQGGQRPSGSGQTSISKLQFVMRVAFFAEMMIRLRYQRVITINRCFTFEFQKLWIENQARRCRKSVGKIMPYKIYRISFVLNYVMLVMLFLRNKTIILVCLSAWFSSPNFAMKKHSV